MREILFRGKASDDFDTNIDGVQKGDWVYGYYYFCNINQVPMIITTLSVESGGVGSGIGQVNIEVDPETIGQCTGRKDGKRTKKYPKGQEIYGSDIIKIWDFIDCNLLDICEVRYEDWDVGFLFLTKCGHISEVMSRSLRKEESYTIEVVGNIYENPEILNPKGE